MKILFLVLATIFGTLPVKGLVLEGSLPIGDAQVLEDYLVQKTSHFNTAFYQEGGGGYINRRSQYSSYDSMESLKTDYSIKLQENAHELATTDSWLIDKDKPILFYTMFISRDNNVTLTTWYQSFKLEKIGTNYFAPDLSHIRPQFDSYITIWVPNLKWARYEVRPAGTQPSTSATTPTVTVDSRYQSPIPLGWVNTTQGVIVMPKEYGISGLTGPWRIKISTVTGNGDFEVWNSVGQKVAETPLKMEGFSVDNAHVHFTVTGGDPGRVFKVQKTSDFSTWTDHSGNYTVPDNQSVQISLAKPVENASSFRLVTVPVVPAP